MKMKIFILIEAEIHPISISVTHKRTDKCNPVVTLESYLESLTAPDGHPDVVCVDHPSLVHHDVGGAGACLRTESMTRRHTGVGPAPARGPGGAT